MRRAACVLLALLAGAAAAKEEPAGGAQDWDKWVADTDITSTASLQRGARNFVNYCLGCHSLQYIRYSQVAEDLNLTEEQMKANLMFTGERAHDYILSSMPPADAERWFGRAPPDLSLMARARGRDHIYRFLKTFYVDESRPTGVNNLALENAAMPHVLADLQGLQKAVFVLEKQHEAGQEKMLRRFDHFEPVSPGRMNEAEYDAFVNDIVNFLDYVGEPVRAKREHLGIWVILFLLVFTGFAWALKKEIWKDVH
jgi:ubiquinol-cytochrome c reductase cytochrome c1 subunit